MKITEIDKHLNVETKIDAEGLVFKNALEAPFKIYGIFHDGKQYRRMPYSVSSKTNEGCNRLSTNTAGGRVRFITDSPYVAIKVNLPHNCLFSHMPKTGISGFDIYETVNGVEKYKKMFVPPFDFKDSYESIYYFTEPGEHFITLNFPLYNNVYDLYIGLKEDSLLKESPEYKINKPIVFYGSSITQGGCASRPGHSYQGFICRELDADHINLGFSGSGMGELAVAEYIASLNMSAFVLDYDHNAPNLEHYLATHEPFFKTVRAAHPDLPIILLTRPKLALNEEEKERVKIARRTYENALAEGDKNVSFIVGGELLEGVGDEGLVDGCHPTDLGFFFMAKRLGAELKKVLL